MRIRILVGIIATVAVVAGASAVSRAWWLPEPASGVANHTAMQPSAGEPRFFSVTASYGTYTLGDLRVKADAAVLFKATGNYRAHWNDSLNAPWALDEVGKTSHIYRDEEIEVTKVLLGSLVPSTVIVRALGGTVGAVTIEYEEDAPLEAGQTYLGFLRLEDTPTREGSERFWTFVWQGNGVFRQQNGAWQNSAGIEATEAALAP